MNWQAYAIGAMIVLGVMNFFVKLTVMRFDPIVSAGVVLSIGGLLILAFSGLTGGLELTPDMALFMVPTGILAGVGMYLAYKALSLGDASKAIPIVNLNTLVVVILAVALLKEGLTLRSGLGIVFAVLSIYLLSV